MTPATNDLLPTHPDDCDACGLFAPHVACPAHTCPDCGSITSAGTNAERERTHGCP